MLSSRVKNIQGGNRLQNRLALSRTQQGAPLQARLNNLQGALRNISDQINQQNAYTSSYRDAQAVAPPVPTTPPPPATPAPVPPPNYSFTINPTSVTVSVSGNLYTVSGSIVGSGSLTQGLMRVWLGAPYGGAAYTGPGYGQKLTSPTGGEYLVFSQPITISTSPPGNFAFTFSLPPGFNPLSPSNLWVLTASDLADSYESPAVLLPTPQSTTSTTPGYPIYIDPSSLTTTVASDGTYTISGTILGAINWPQAWVRVWLGTYYNYAPTYPPSPYPMPPPPMPTMPTPNSMPPPMPTPYPPSYAGPGFGQKLLTGAPPGVPVLVGGALVNITNPPGRFTISFKPQANIPPLSTANTWVLTAADPVGNNETPWATLITGPSQGTTTTTAPHLHVQFPSGRIESKYTTYDLHGRLNNINWPTVCVRIYQSSVYGQKGNLVAQSVFTPTGRSMPYRINFTITVPLMLHTVNHHMITVSSDANGSNETQAIVAPTVRHEHEREEGGAEEALESFARQLRRALEHANERVQEVKTPAARAAFEEAVQELERAVDSIATEAESDAVIIEEIAEVEKPTRPSRLRRRRTEEEEAEEGDKG